MNTIQEALAQGKDYEIEGVVTNIQEIKQGTISKGENAGGTWKNQKCQITDPSGTADLTLWGDECGTIQPGEKIHIIGGYSNEYKGNVSLTVGRFGKMEKIS
jgi:ssDNA-binding replication factor A large subunit